MSATVYKWIIVYEDGRTEEKWAESLYAFEDALQKYQLLLSEMYGNDNKLKATNNLTLPD